MLDFQRIKEVPVRDVCLRYGIALKFKGEWATAAKCPLPTHESESTGTFAVNVKENYWVCHSQSCRAKSGKGGGDVLSFVTIMEKLTDKDADKAAQRIAQWFNIPNKKAAHMERPVAEGRKPLPATHQNRTPVSDSVKVMASVDPWFDQLIQRGDQEDEESYLKRVRNGFKSALIRSFRNGKRVAEGLQPEPLI